MSIKVILSFFAFVKVSNCLIFGLIKLLFPFFRCFPWFSEPGAFSVSHLLCACCLFLVHWLTHSSHEITSCLTSPPTSDGTVKRTCRKGGRFREIPLNKGYPQTKKSYIHIHIPLPLKVLVNLHHAQRPQNPLRPFPAFHSFFLWPSFHLFFPCHAIWLCMVLIHSKWQERIIYSALLLLYFFSSCYIFFHLCNLQANDTDTHIHTLVLIKLQDGGERFYIRSLALIT